MSIKGSWMTLKFRGVVDVVRASRFRVNYGGFKRNTPIVTASKVGNSSWMMQPSIQFFSTKRNTITNANRLAKHTFSKHQPLFKFHLQI